MGTPCLLHRCKHCLYSWIFAVGFYSGAASSPALDGTKTFPFHFPDVEGFVFFVFLLFPSSSCNAFQLSLGSQCLLSFYQRIQPFFLNMQSSRQGFLLFPLHRPNTIFFFFLNFSFNSFSGLPWWLSFKESTCQCRRCGFYPWVRRTSCRGNGNPLQCFCLGNPMDREVWWAIVQVVAKESDTT